MTVLEKERPNTKNVDLKKIENEGVKKTVRLDNQVFGVIYLNPESDHGPETVRKTEFLVEQDAADAANYYIVVHAGQMFYLRNICEREIEIEYEDGMFVDPNTNGPLQNPIVLPKKVGSLESVFPVRIKKDAAINKTIFLRAKGAGNGHGSPTLIVRKPPVGSS